MIFGRGPKIASDMPIELWDSLQGENMGVPLGGKVNTEMLAVHATRLAVSAGQTIVFNPSQPHMGVTRRAPRHSNATFFTIVNKLYLRHNPGDFGKVETANALPSIIRSNNLSRFCKCVPWNYYK